MRLKRRGEGNPKLVFLFRNGAAVEEFSVLRIGIRALDKRVKLLDIFWGHRVTHPPGNRKADRQPSSRTGFGCACGWLVCLETVVGVAPNPFQISLGAFSVLKFETHRLPSHHILIINKRNPKRKEKRVFLETRKRD